MRLRNIPNSLEKIQASNFLANTPILINKSWVIEIGMGKGEMLTKLALQNPNKIFLGIEKFSSAAVKSLKFAQQNDLKNFFILIADAKILPTVVNGKTDEIWLTFPDPWPKNRHFKRRLTYKFFLDIYSKLLSKNGILKLKTDNNKFFAFSEESLIENGWKIIYKTDNLAKSHLANSNVQTGYEIKWTQKGFKINYLEATYIK
ncbi:tRNA (guanosine(46)-N7)-methyltransferase TrmB [Mycoplasma sp. 'Moose RK']|uniref:tRNA (guanosine(46)-N7)-methyltransferase TrmB n=1 Tax=Mycoplasma sp. 'Moose RK' TaxID=2780095 RepID=UPI0018C25815|nr:tRNA (guanosine(46)-N7)-methyltransferase TrmB [Mycoplasma sp. 'Moose RK']MBG0730698.1 tRNA (guanosine(46)-N7)-methyltransferase TrmB [Mycoplasma sp. 'Moose RK']